MNVKDLARFFNVSMDEIFNGEREIVEDYEKKYFICKNEWAMSYDKKANLWEIRNQQELDVEKRFNELIRGLVANTLSTTEEKEFDFIVTQFYTIKDERTIDEVKFQVRKQVALMHKSNFKEKHWEAYKCFSYNKKLGYFKDLCDNVFEGGADMLGKRIKNSPDFEKDILLAFVQKNNINHRYGKDGGDLFFKRFGVPYDEEMLTKQVIKLLIENGACLCEDLLGYEETIKEERYIVDILKEGYRDYKKPLIVSVFENNQYTYYLVDNTIMNRKLLDVVPRYEVEESILPDLEERLYNGEKEYCVEFSCWNGIDSIYKDDDTEHIEYLLEEARDYVMNVVESNNYESYCKKRNKKKTKALLADLDSMSLSEIREKYFTLEKK